MYKIMGSSNGIEEEIDSTDDADDAEYLKAEYRMAFGEKWIIWVEG